MFEPKRIREAFEIMGGIVLLIIAGFVVQWWLFPGVVLFCLGLIFLCWATVEQDLGDKRF